MKKICHKCNKNISNNNAKNDFCHRQRQSNGNYKVIQHLYYCERCINIIRKKIGLSEEIEENLMRNYIPSGKIDEEMAQKSEMLGHDPLVCDEYCKCNNRKK